MPSKDPKLRAKQQADWRKRSYTPEYMRWLGARRKLKIEKGKKYERALTLIAEGGANPARRAQIALHEASYAERELGNRFDHEKNEPYYDENRKS